MKKILLIMMLFVNLVSFGTMKDGIYSVEKSFTSNWKSFAKITVKYLSTQNVDQIEEVKDKESLSEFKTLIKFLIQKSENGETGNYKM